MKGIIFDLDGTLLDSFHARVEAWKKSLEMNDINVDPVALRPLIGLPGIVLASYFSKNPEKIEQDEEKIFREMIHTHGFFPDVSDTLRNIEKNGDRWIVVTSSRRTFVDLLPLPREKIITVDDVSNGKPSTEAYELAMSRMGTSRGNTIVVGDSLNDMIPAKILNIRCFLVTHGEERDIAVFDDKIKEISEILKFI